MLAKRIIPTLLFRGDTLVKGKQFKSWRSVGSVVQAAKIYGHRGADEIIFLDINATPEGRGPNLKIVEKIADDFFTPLTVGGGVRSIDDVRDLLNAGADKVAICTNLGVIQKAAEKFGSQAIVGVIDAIGSDTFVHCGTQRSVYGTRELAIAIESLGAGEILYTAIDREGMFNGYDIDMLRVIADAVTVPVIAHGGCGGMRDTLRAIEAGASGVAIGSMFQFTNETPRDVAIYLNAHGVEVRI